MSRRPAAELRQSQYAQCAYVLFIEGIDVAFTDSYDPGLLGTAWINGSVSLIPSAIDSDRHVVQRRIVPGLKFSRNLQLGDMDFASGILDKTSVRVSLVDLEREVIELFQSVGIEYDPIDPSSIPRGLENNYPASLPVLEGNSGPSSSVTVNPRNKYVNLERVGPNGEKMQLPPMPIRWAMRGHYYNVHPEAPMDLVRVSTRPMIWEGRKVAIYRIYKDPEQNTGTSSDWVPWREAHNAGDLLFFGEMRGAAEVKGKVIDIAMFGPESWMAKKVGWDTPQSEVEIYGVAVDYSVDVLTSEESYIGVVYVHTYLSWNVSLLRSEYVHAPLSSHDLGRASTLPWRQLPINYPGGHSELRDAVSDYIDSVSAGTSLGGAANNLETSSDKIGDKSASFELVGGQFRIQFPQMRDQGLEVYVCMHEKVWNLLGFDTSQADAYSTASIPFLQSPTFILDGAFTSPVTLPGSFFIGEKVIFESIPRGYVIMKFSTWFASERHRTSNFDRCNNGFSKFYNPRWAQQPVGSLTGTAFVLPPDGPINIGMGTIDGEPPRHRQNTLRPSNAVDWTVAVQPGLWLFSGGNSRVQNDGSLVDSEEEKQIGVVQEAMLLGWLPSPPIEDWKPITRPWGIDGPVKAMALSSYVTSTSSTVDSMVDVLSQIMLSTGDSAGFVATSTGTNIEPGYNTWGSGIVRFLAKDVHQASMGIAIPREMMQSYEDFVSTIDQAPGGRNGPLCNGRLMFPGTKDSYDVIKSLLVPRGLGVSLHGKRFSLFARSEAPSAEPSVTVGQSDIAGSLGSPDTTIPEQSFAAMAKVDYIVLKYGTDPAGGGNSGEINISLSESSSIFRSFSRSLNLDDNFLAITDGARAIWLPIMRDYYTRVAAEMLNRPHSELRFTVHRTKGQDMMPGTIFSITNPWIIKGDGTYGVSNGRAIVTRVMWSYSKETYDIEAVLMSDGMDSPPLLLPIAKVRGTDGVNVYLDAPYYWPGRNITSAFMRPPIADDGLSQGSVVIFDESGATFGPYTVAGHNPEDSVLVLETAPSGLKRDVHKWICFAPQVDQPSNSWLNQHAAYITDPDGTFYTTERGKRLR